MHVMYAKRGGPHAQIAVAARGLLLTVAAHAQAPVAKPTLQDFAWLAGHWRIEQGDRLIDEHWMAPAGGLMMGMARNVQAGKVREYEFTMLRQEPNGDILYIASPSKQTEATFKLTSLRGGEAVFENPNTTSRRRSSTRARPTARCSPDRRTRTRRQAASRRVSVQARHAIASGVYG